MKTKTICSFLVLFAIVAGMVTTTPAAFADHSEVTIETVEGSGQTQDCIEAGCYTPSTVTVDVGGKVIMTNTDPVPGGIHTFTAVTEAGSLTASDVFDTGTLMQGDSFEYIADTVGEIPYVCIIHPWMVGLIIVEEAGAEEETHEDETTEETHEDVGLMVDIATGSANQGESLSIDVTFTMMGEGVEHVNYDIKATQNGEVVLDELGLHEHEGVGNHMTDPLPAAASDDAPVEVDVMFNGFGIDEPFTGPIGQVETAQVVPEFGTVAMMILAVAIISIVAVTSKSRVIPRL